MFHVCHIFLSVHCSLVVTCWKRADLLALLSVMVYCVFVTFPYGILCQVWCLIVSVPDLGLLSYFACNIKIKTLCLWVPSCKETSMAKPHFKNHRVTKSLSKVKG